MHSAKRVILHCGYIYDTDTGLYYLQSRYYDPKVGRFLNADVIFDHDVGIIGYDLFTYCGNNPVRYIDISGTDCTDMLDGDFDEDDPYTFEGGGGDGKGPSSPPHSSGGTIRSANGSTTSGNGSIQSEISTGRTTANNLHEQLAMESARSNPTAGKIIIQEISDARFPVGSSKYQQTFHTSRGIIVIHYVGNADESQFYDFKYIN